MLEGLILNCYAESDAMRKWSLLANGHIWEILNICQQQLLHLVTCTL